MDLVTLQSNALIYSLILFIYSFFLWLKVLNRGSQYRVEAALLIRAHQEDYILISPSKRQVASQAAMEVIPLVMEPESNFYVDPILVLDFQSLYPSMVIAYNLCFSTIFGKLRPGQGASIDASFHDCYPGSGHSTNQETTGRLGVIEYSEATAALNATLATDASPGDREVYSFSLLTSHSILGAFVVNSAY